MRVTEETKQATRQAILDAAVKLFRSKGFEETTTRDLTREARIAVGTLFNYFPTKEAIVTQLVSDALAAGDAKYQKRRRNGATLQEDLFLLVATGLRSLKPLRTILKPALDAGFSPAASTDRAAASARGDHLDAVSSLLVEHGMAEPPTAAQLQIYWMLYVGVLSFWSADDSPKQEDTLAMLDQTVDMFAGWLDRSTDKGFS